MSTASKSVGVLGTLLVSAWAFQPAVRLTAALPSTTRAIVVAELFTSEGCSSCPPADAVLSQLVLGQPVESAEVLALGEHVDYWDRLGWKDPFSSALYSSRQSNYDDHVFHRHEVYTPQFVVDGRLERLGSDIGAVHRAIKQAAQDPKASVDVAAARASERALHVDVHVNVPASLTLRENADVLVAIAEDNLVTEVRRGENGGRTLRHNAVVRFDHGRHTVAARSHVVDERVLARRSGMEAGEPSDHQLSTGACEPPHRRRRRCAQRRLPGSRRQVVSQAALTERWFLRSLA